MERPANAQGIALVCVRNAWRESARDSRVNGRGGWDLPKLGRSGAMTRYLSERLATWLSQMRLSSGKPWTRTRGRPRPRSVYEIVCPLILTSGMKPPGKAQYD